MVNHRGRRIAMGAFVIIAMILMASGYLYYRMEIVELTREKYKALAAIGERKSLQLEQWRKERQMDAYRMSHGSTVNALEDFLSFPDDARLRAHLRERLELEVESGDGVDALLLSPAGDILIAAGDSHQPISPALHRAIQAALASQESVISEFYRESRGKAVYVDTVEAVRDAAGHPLAVVAIRNDANSYLFPMIQDWPLPSLSAETLLVERDGEEVVYLNRLRHKDNSIHPLREPLTRIEIPAVQAVLGKKGIYEGKDYRGVPVLSDLCAIPSSPWFIVAKVDSEEIFAEARFRTISICLIVGAFIMMFGVFIAYLYRQWKADIAERNREAEREKLAAVHETQALLQAALNISQVGIAIADAPSGTLRYVNDAGLVILGVDSQSVVAGVGIDQYVSSWQMLALDRRPMDPDEIPLTRAIRYGETCSREFIIQRAVGDERIIQANAAPIRDALGKVSAAIVVFIDITESKQMEEDLRKKNAEIERFTYTVSHDLKSPLVTIKTFLVYLEKDLKAQKVERAAKDLSFIHGAVDKMALLLDELLELARVGYHTTLPEEMRLQDVVQDAQSLVSGQIDARGVEVVVTQEPVWLYGDRPRLMEVFQNLLDNAVKFLGDQPAPHVEIGAEQVGDELELFVRDNGKGIDQRYHTKVFGLFEKLDASAKGSGLGLALVKRIVELHGGKIWVQSEGPGQGTTFRFTLAKTRLRQRAPALT